MADMPAQAAPKAVSNDHHAWITAIASPWAMLGFAAFTGIFWFIATQMTINTSEVWYLTNGYGQHLAANQVTLMPHFGLVDQFRDLFGGANTSAQQAALLYAWFQEAFTVIFSVGGVHYALQVVNKKGGATAGIAVAKQAQARNYVFNGGMIVTFAWDAYTDYVYGSGNDIARIAFTTGQGLVSFFFLPICIICLRAAWAMWSK